MKKILILMGRYLPGHKDGGPLRTIVNLTDTLGDKYDFRIACFDRDHGDNNPYPTIKHNEWNKVGKASVWYVNKNKFTYKLIRFLSNDVDLVYCCGFYESYGYKTLILNKLNKLHHIPICVAPMGVFSQGALMQKSFKKKLFINFLKSMHLFKKITWSVTSELEANDLKNTIGNDSKYVIAEDLPRHNVLGMDVSNLQNNRIIYLSRISPKKNLIGAIKALSSIKTKVLFDIYGPKEDEKYWEKCEIELKKLPNNVVWNYCGDVDSDKVQEIFQKYNLFLFPTLGENYGHVIFESLSAGCVPIISDQTPWNAIEEKGAGFVVKLTNDMLSFSKTIDDFFSLDLKMRKKYSSNAVEFANKKVAESKKTTGYITLFESF